MKSIVSVGLDKVASAIARRVYQRRNYDFVALAHYRAAMETAEFYTNELLHCREFTDHEEMIRSSLDLARIDGLTLEFGVASGRTINIISKYRHSRVYGFDSFQGLPESWYGTYNKGAFARSDLPLVPDNVTLVQGWFVDTLPEFLENHQQQISFLHIDSDLYSSASFIFAAARDRIVPGTVILFDEYFNYPGWQNHEHRAFMEFIEATGLHFSYESFLRNSQPVCVRIIADPDR